MSKIRLPWFITRHVLFALIIGGLGGIMVIQAGIFVERFNASGLVGWGAGYTIFRELGPVLIALMFSGRVGSNNTAETIRFLWRRV